MAPSMRNENQDSEEFSAYVEDILIDALRDGTIAPTTLLECVYYAVEPDLLASIRSFVALGPAERLMVMSYAKKLSCERVAAD